MIVKKRVSGDFNCPTCVYNDYWDWRGYRDLSCYMGVKDLRSLVPFQQAYGLACCEILLVLFDVTCCF